PRPRRAPARAGHAVTVTLKPGPLSFHEVVEVARHDAPVAVSSESCAAMADSRAVVDRIAARDDMVVYGVTTGLGALANTHISPDQRIELQRALIRSHAAGSGPPLEREVVRAMMLLRAATLARGFSGVRPAVVQQIAAVLNAGITPVVPTYGSLGASGDLAPLAHAALCLIGEGRATIGAAEEVDAATAL